jgi:hypothetical protein
MLDPDVTETGVAVAHSAQSGHFYAVQMFGRPKSRAIEIRITNRSDTTIEYDVGEDRFSLPPSYIRTHERCRPTEVAMRLPVAGLDEPRIQTIAVDDLARLAVSRDDAGSLQVERESPQDAN